MDIFVCFSLLVIWTFIHSCWFFSHLLIHALWLIHHFTTFLCCLLLDFIFLASPESLISGNAFFFSFVRVKSTEMLSLVMSFVLPPKHECFSFFSRHVVKRNTFWLFDFCSLFSRVCVCFLKMFAIVSVC